MMKLDFSIIEEKEITVFGLRQASNDRTQAKDIPTLSNRYYETVGKSDDNVMPLFVISSSYDKGTGNFLLSIGGLIEGPGLETLSIPKGLYGKVTVNPKMGFLWGAAIGEAKRSFYTQWLPRSNYVPLDMEYEYHTERSKEKNPQIDILFAVKKKENKDAD